MNTDCIWTFLHRVTFNMNVARTDSHLMGRNFYKYAAILDTFRVSHNSSLLSEHKQEAWECDLLSKRACN